MPPTRPNALFLGICQLSARINAISHFQKGTYIELSEHALDRGNNVAFDLVLTHACIICKFYLVKIDLTHGDIGFCRCASALARVLQNLSHDIVICVLHD
jgi:hypothetical protein